MGRPLSGKSAPKGRVSLIERFGGTVDKPEAKAVTIKKTTTVSPSTKKVEPKKKAEPAPVAGTAGGAAARKTVLSSNEARMAIARKRLADKKNIK